MSLKMSISCSRETLPDAAKWNACMAESGFDVIAEDVDWSVASRYQPMTMLGRSTGYRVKLQSKDDMCRLTLHPNAGLEFTVALVSLATLMHLTNGKYSDNDRMKYSLDDLVTEACEAYWCDRVLLARLGNELIVLPIDQPPLASGESREFRQRIVDHLVSKHQLKADASGGINGYRLHKIYRDRLLAEINSSN